MFICTTPSSVYARLELFFDLVFVASIRVASARIRQEDQDERRTRTRRRRRRGRDC